MKKLLIACAAMAALMSCSKLENSTKSIVVYYSQTGATKQVAELIQQKTGADMLAIDAAEPYDGDFGQTIARCQQEMAEGVLPQLQPNEVALDAYDTIYVGYPIWFGTYAPPMAAWLNANSLAGKVVVPFCTFGSGGLETGIADLLKLQPEAEILSGFGIRNARISKAENEVSQWLMRLGAIAGEAEELPLYGPAEPLNEETQAIYDEATSSYSMPIGKAVCVQVAAEPTHMLFTAEIEDKDGNVHHNTVYVEKYPGQPAEFTRVVR